MVTADTQGRDQTKKKKKTAPDRSDVLREQGTSSLAVADQNLNDRCDYTLSLRQFIEIEHGLLENEQGVENLQIQIAVIVAHCSTEALRQTEAGGCCYRCQHSKSPGLRQCVAIPRQVT